MHVYASILSKKKKTRLYGRCKNTFNEEIENPETSHVILYYRYPVDNYWDSDDESVPLSYYRFTEEARGR